MYLASLDTSSCLVSLVLTNKQSSPISFHESIENLKPTINGGVSLKSVPLVLCCSLNTVEVKNVVATKDFSKVCQMKSKDDLPFSVYVGTEIIAGHAVGGKGIIIEFFADSMCSTISLSDDDAIALALQILRKRKDIFEQYQRLAKNS